MQRISTFIGGVLAVVAVVALAIFALQNTQSVQMGFLGASFASAPSVVALVAAMVALLVAFVLLLPARVAAGRHSSKLSTQYAQREKELTSLRDAHTQLGAQHDIVLADFTRLRGEHGRIVAERDGLLAQLAPATPTSDAIAADAPELARDTVIATQVERPVLADEPAEVAAEGAGDGVREDMIIAQVAPVGGLPVLDLSPAVSPPADPAQDVILASTAPATPVGTAGIPAADLAVPVAASDGRADVPEALFTAES